MRFRRPQRPRDLSVLALVATVVLTYANIFDNAFLFDDEFLVLKNTYLDSFAAIGRIFASSSTAGAGFSDSFYRPAQGVAYLLINQAFGREPWAFHALNVALHALNAVMVWRLGRRLGLKPAAALIGALLWAVHPLHVEAITYVSATADPLHAGFALLALNLLLPRQTRGTVAAATVAGAAALLSKESAIVVPALVMVILFMTSARRWSWRAYVVSLPFWAVAAGYFLMRRSVLGAAQSLIMFKHADVYADHPLTRAWTALATIPAYLELIAWPHDLHMDREFATHATPWSPAVGAGAVILLGGIAVMIAAARRRTPPLIFAAGLIAWVLVAHAPHSGVLLAVNSVFLEHWMYLTAIPVFWTVGLAVSRVRGPALRGGVAAALVIAYAQKTRRQNLVWATPVRFFSHTLAYSPTSARIRHNLANALMDAGRVDEGLDQLELMIRANTPYPATYHTAAHVYLTRHEYARAEPYYLKALALDPNFHPSLQELAILYALKGEPAKSEEFTRRFRALRP